MHKFEWKVMPEDKKLWYRITERENKSVKNNFLIGDYVKFERVIARIGYYYEPKDIPDRLIVERANAKIIELANLPSYPPEEERIVINQEIINRVQAATGIGEAMFWKHIRYTVRGEWVREMSEHDKEHDCKLRTIYYEDRSGIGRVEWATTRKFGRYYAPEIEYDEYGKPYDIDPGGLCDGITQVILTVRGDDGTSYEIHPADAVIVGGKR